MIKNVVLCGLIYDDNLGDQAIFECTKSLLVEIGDFNFEFIDLYGRTQKENTEKYGFYRRFLGKLIPRYDEHRIIKRLKKEIKSKINTRSDALIFCGGGLIKYNHQFIALPVKKIIDKCELLNIPVMFSAVGVEGYDSSAECQSLKWYINRACVKCITTRDDIKTLTEKYIINNKISCAMVADPAIHISEIFPGGGKNSK